jgi:hypothetical protein
MVGRLCPGAILGWFPPSCTVFFPRAPHRRWQKKITAISQSPSPDFETTRHKVTFLAACVQLSLNVASGFGRPEKTVDPADLDRAGFGGLIVGTMYLTAVTTSKISFMITLSKISGPKLLIALWIAGVSLGVFQAASMIVQWVQCWPLEKTWNPFMQSGSGWLPSVNLGMSMGSTGK